MPESFQHVGTVKRVPESGRHVIAEVPGKVALVVSDVHAGDLLGYFPRDGRPKVGVRVGASGSWVQVEVPLSALDSEELADLCAGGETPVGTPFQLQLDVRAWRVVSEDYEPRFY